MADTHLVDWLEVKGFAVDFFTDEDLHFEGAPLLAPYKAVLTATHPEYYSIEMRTALRGYLNAGGRLMYLGGNGFYWVTPMDPTGRFIEVRRRDGTEHWQGAPGEHYHSLTGEPGGLWRFRGMAPQQYVGVGFTAQGFDRNSPYRRKPGSFDPARLVHLRRDRPRRADRRTSIDGARDSARPDRSSTALTSRSARRRTRWCSPPRSATPMRTSMWSNRSTRRTRRGRAARRTHSCMPTWRSWNIRHGGAVFSTSAIAWCGSLSYNNYTNNVSRITENVLRRFAADAPLPAPRRLRTTQGQ